MYRKTYIEIDGNVLENNIKEIRKKYNDYKYYIGVIKANCYGHGVDSIKYLIKGGINYIATSSLEEALKAREIDSKIPILVLEPIHVEDMLVAAKNNIAVTIDNVNVFKELKKQKPKIKIHIKVDSGMNRFGFKNKEDIKYIYDNCDENIVLEGIFTHLTCGFGETLAKEMQTFEELTSLIDLSRIPIVHIDRSLTLEQHTKISYANGTRLGILMYGFNKQQPVISWKRKLYNKLLRRKGTANPSKLELNTTFKFYTEVIEIKEVKKGDIIGYKGMYNADKDMTIAILSVGFADYTLINKSYVIINGNKYPIIVLSMDLVIVAVDDKVKLYDKAEVFGDKISIREASRHAGKNVYQTLTSITYRVPRVYIYNNKQEKEK